LRVYFVEKISLYILIYNLIVYLDLLYA